jgi:selenide, water dikinase
MKNDAIPIVKDLVLVGGGHSHVSVLKKFAMKPIPGVRLTLVCRDVAAPYSGMLPGYIAGHYTFDEAHIDLGPLARFAGARFLHDTASGLDLVNRKVLFADRPPVSYDLLSINIGARPRTYDIPGVEDNVTPVKPIDGFVAHWERFKARVLETTGPVSIGVVGAGAGGVETLLAIQFNLGTLIRDQGGDPDRLAFHLVTDTDDILPTHNASVRNRFRRVLAERGVTLHLDRAVQRVSRGHLHCTEDLDLPLDEILWVTDAGAPSWPGDCGLAVDDVGFIKVDDSLQSISHPGVFAAGDIAAVINHPRPKSGVFAVRQGPPLSANLRRALLGRRLRPFTPQRHFLSLITTGDRHAVASRGAWAFEGKAVWRWKDWIDRRFMDKYNDLPEMDDDEVPALARGLADADVIKEISAMAMRCGGCGAKVGSTVLSRALETLEPVQRDDVLIGLHEPDDAAMVSVGNGHGMVHTVDSFRSFIDDPYVFGQVAANHALGDVFAMGGEAQTALAIVTVPFGLEEKVENDLTQMMAGAMTILDEAGTALVGGHTSEGAELSLGFAVNGLVEAKEVLRKGGMKAGDRLVLTKGLGTGALFAADMRQKAKGRWIEGAVRSMVQSNRAGADCLFEHGATACTDVTGFGLLGHLVEMTRPSEVDVELDLAAIPLLDGARETVEAGIFSSLQPQNVRLRRAIRDVDAVADDPRYPLIFDPQTAGGLLASVPGDNAEACVLALQGLGYTAAAIIGAVQPMSNALEPIVVRV